MRDLRTISELITYLEEIKIKEGDIAVCSSESHDYWGSIEGYLSDWNVKVTSAQPDGPKSGKSVKAVVFSYGY